MKFNRSKSLTMFIPLCISISAVLPAFSLDFVESKRRVEQSLTSAKAAQVNRSDLRRALELNNAVQGMEKKFAKGGFSDTESKVMLALYEQLERQINFNIGRDDEQHLRAIGFEDVLAAGSGTAQDRSESLARSGPLDNKLYLLRFKVDAGAYSKQLSTKDSQFFNDEIVRLRKLEDKLSDENGMINADAKESISKIIDLIDLDLKLRVTEGPFSKVVGARQLKTTCRPAPPAPPYTWYQSRLGGYFEVTGQINGRFSEDAISQYGGVKYKDGHATPISRVHAKSAVKAASSL